MEEGGALVPGGGGGGGGLVGSPRYYLRLNVITLGYGTSDCYRLRGREFHNVLDYWVVGLICRAC